MGWNQPRNLCDGGGKRLCSGYRDRIPYLAHEMRRDETRLRTSGAGKGHIHRPILLLIAREYFKSLVSSYLVISSFLIEVESWSGARRNTLSKQLWLNAGGDMCRCLTCQWQTKRSGTRCTMLMTIDR